MDPGIAHTTHGLAQRGYGATVSGRWGQGIVQSNTTPKFLVKHTHTRVVPPKSNPPPLSHLPHLKYLQKSNRICPYTATSAIEREKDKKKNAAHQNPSHYFYPRHWHLPSRVRNHRLRLLCRRRLHFWNGRRSSCPGRHRGVQFCVWQLSGRLCRAGAGAYAVNAFSNNHPEWLLRRDKIEDSCDLPAGGTSYINQNGMGGRDIEVIH